MDIVISNQSSSSKMGTVSMRESATVSQQSGTADEAGIMQTNESQLSLQGDLWIMKLLLEKLIGKQINVSEPLSQHSEKALPINSEHMQSITLHGEVKTLQAENINSDFVLTHELFVESKQQLSLNVQSGKQSGEVIIDPLVINLERDFADLESAKFHFDLNVDGVKDWVPMLAEGSAFLALDKNNNQKIDDGNELFGPQSGDGFADLAKYDENNDGKIDKQDTVFAQLKVWRPGGQLLALADVGVQSISLHSAIDEKMLRNEQGKLLGIARKSAEFTRTDGQMGRMQHIDMVI